MIGFGPGAPARSPLRLCPQARPPIDKLEGKAYSYTQNGRFRKTVNGRSRPRAGAQRGGGRWEPAAHAGAEWARESPDEPGGPRPQ